MIFSNETFQFSFFLEEKFEVFRKPIDNVFSAAWRTSLRREPVQFIILTLGNTAFDSRLYRK